MRRFYLGLITVTFFCLQPMYVTQSQNYFSSTAFSEPAAPYESDILSARPVRYFAGIGIGAMAFQHVGNFSPECNCEFSSAKGIRPIYAAEFSVQYPKLGFAFKGMLSYLDYSADFSRKSIRSSVVVDDNPNIDVEYENTSNVQLKYLVLTGSLAWYFPYTQLFIFAGGHIGYPLKARYNHIETILTKGVYYYDGSISYTLLPEQDIPGGKNLRFGLSAGIGFDIILSARFTLTPQFGADYPITPVSSHYGKWRVASEYGMLFLKYRL